MNIDRVGVGERMRSLTVGELRQIVENPGGAHDSDEVDAANEELTSRFRVYDDALFGNIPETGDVSMPVGLRVLFYLVSCAAVWESLMLVFFVSVLFGSNRRIPSLIEAILHVGVPAAWAIWVAFTIRSDHAYVRGSLLSLLGLAVIVKVTRVFLGQQFTYWNWIVLGALVVALGYVAFSSSVRCYYGAVSGR